MRILVIEDDIAVSQSIELMLRSEGLSVEIAETGEEGVDRAKVYSYDIITSDIDLPDINGFEVVRQIRAAKVKTPILMVSGRAGVTDKVKALGLGADDYLTKPFHKDEFIARIYAVVRRAAGHPVSIIQTGVLMLNLDTKTADVAGQLLHLTGKEYRLLELLSLRKGATVTKEMIMDHLYGGMDEPELKIIDVFVCKLRKKLDAACGGIRYVETVWGRGYMLREPVAEIA